METADNLVDWRDIEEFIDGSINHSVKHLTIDLRKNDLALFLLNHLPQEINEHVNKLDNEAVANVSPKSFLLVLLRGVEVFVVEGSEGSNNLVDEERADKAPNGKETTHQHKSLLQDCKVNLSIFCSLVVLFITK